MDFFRKFENKIVRQGLAQPRDLYWAVFNETFIWNQRNAFEEVLEKTASLLNINSLLMAKPAEPYFSILNSLTARFPENIQPEDTETRTFFHDIPVARSFSPEALVPLLKKRKIVFIPDQGIVTHGSLSPEQTFVNFSSVCFSSFTAFCCLLLRDAGKRKVDSRQREIFFKIKEDKEKFFLKSIPRLCEGPFRTETEALEAIDEAGSALVSLGLVDSNFGNISLRFKDSVFISETSAALDELKGNVVQVPLDGRNCMALTASSEFSVHRRILTETPNTCILHGHPVFSVVLSMDCENENCPGRRHCYKRCPEKRKVCGFPVVSGEVGRGEFGISETVPRSMKQSPAVLVYGHGVFTASVNDYNEALKILWKFEQACWEEFLNRFENRVTA